MRETEVNCDAARFFLRQTVGVRAGQRLDQRALAMINVARRRNNEMVLCHSRAVSPALPGRIQHLEAAFALGQSAKPYFCLKRRKRN